MKLLFLVIFCIFVRTPLAAGYEVYLGMCFAEQLGDIERADEWDEVAGGIDGIWLNVVGWPDPKSESLLGALKLVKNNQRAILPVTVKSYEPTIELGDPAIEPAKYLKKAGVFDWQIISLNGDSARNRYKEPFRAEAVAAVRKKYPGKSVYVNVRVGEFTAGPKARTLGLMEAADGVTFECEPKRFFEIKDSWKGYSAAYRLTKAQKKPFVWLCPNGGYGVKEDYLDELKQVFGKMRSMKMVPDIIVIIGYGRTNGPLDELSEGEGKDYPSTLTGAARWIIDERKKDAKKMQR